MRSIVLAGMIAAMVVGGAMSALAQPPGGIPEAARKEPTPGLWGKALTGGQLGPWFSNNLGTDVTTPTTRLDASKTAFHLELFYRPHLVGVVNLDFSLGAISRGDLRIRDGNFSALGDVTLYPISGGVIIYPLAKRTSAPFQPSLAAGGSLIVGTIQATSVDLDVLGYSNESRTALGYYAAVGGNLVLAPSFCLVGTVKYQHVRFDKDLFGTRDYSGTLVLFGAAYMYR